MNFIETGVKMTRMKFFLDFEFSSFSTYFSTIWTSGISGFSKKSKNTIFGLCLSSNTGRRNKNFRNFFRENFSFVPGDENVGFVILVSIIVQKLQLQT